MWMLRKIRRFKGKRFVLMATHKIKADAKKWCQKARGRPHYAKCRIVKGKDGYGHYGVYYGTYTAG